MIKNFSITFAVILFTISAYSQQITLDDWNEQSRSNIRLLPKYGYAQKTEGQKALDKEFVESTIKQFAGNRKASAHLIELGFKYLNQDVKTAMYRFNQAFLLDSTNSDINWGYAAVYMTLQDFHKAQQQFLEGLSVNLNSTHLLTDYGTYFLAQYYGMQAGTDKGKALPQLDSALYYMIKSYNIDPKDQNTTFKLCVVYFLQKDCSKAWKYYNECKLLGEGPITEDFTKALKQQCAQKSQ